MGWKVGICYTALRFCTNCQVDLLIFIAYVKLQNQVLYTDGDYELSLCPR